MPLFPAVVPKPASIAPFPAGDLGSPAGPIESCPHACRDDGVGLAAPQVGVNVRMMVFNETGQRGGRKEQVLPAFSMRGCMWSQQWPAESHHVSLGCSA